MSAKLSLCQQTAQSLSGTFSDRLKAKPNEKNTKYIGGDQCTPIDATAVSKQYRWYIHTILKTHLPLVTLEAYCGLNIFQELISN